VVAPSSSLALGYSEERFGVGTVLCRPATDDPSIVKVNGELDAHEARAFGKAARRVMRGKGRQTIIDLRDCTYIDSAGLGVLFSLVSWARKDGGKVAAVGPRARVLHVLRLVRLTDERGFQVFADLDSARAFMSCE
jgi:anti-anti-sigma factor